MANRFHTPVMSVTYENDECDESALRSQIRSLRESIIKKLTAERTTLDKELENNKMRMLKYISEKHDISVRFVTDIYALKNDRLVNKIKSLNAAIQQEQTINDYDKCCVTNAISTPTDFEADIDAESASPFTMWIFDNFCPCCQRRKNTRDDMVSAIPCAHDLCEKCLLQLVTSTPVTKIPVCPICREPYDYVIKLQYETNKGLGNNLKTTIMYDSRNLTSGPCQKATTML